MARKTIKNTSPVDTVDNSTGMITFTFQVPIQSLQLSTSKDKPETNGHYWQLPYMVTGEMRNGSVVSAFKIVKSKVIIPTAKGQAAYDAKDAKKASKADVRTYTAEQIAALMRG